MLRKVEEGDWVFTIHDGWVRVLKCDARKNIIKTTGKIYYIDGRLTPKDKHPSAWPEGHLDIPHWAPPRPKQKVKKQIEAWVNVNESGIEETIYRSRNHAALWARPNRIACVKLTGEYEVKE